MCLFHAPKIQALPKDDLEKLHFRCPSCHTVKSRATAKAIAAHVNVSGSNVPTLKATKPATTQKPNQSAGRTGKQHTAQGGQPQTPQMGKQLKPQKGKEPPKDRIATPYFVRLCYETLHGVR